MNNFVNLHKGDIFSIDIFSFLNNKLESNPNFKILTEEEIKKYDLLPFKKYGVIMVKYLGN